MSEDLIEKIASILAPLLEREKLLLYDLEIAGGKGSKQLRVYIDKEGGITHDHCVEVSRHLSAVLEVEDLFAGAYTIEVSSPGLTRKLTKPEHFEKSIGKLARITFKKTFNGPSVFIGRLSRDKERLFAATDESANKTVTFNFDNVAKAKLEFEE